MWRLSCDGNWGAKCKPGTGQRLPTNWGTISDKWADSAGQSGDSPRLSDLEDASDQSVEELADTDQAFEAAAVEGVEDAADHPGRPVHTHLEYGRADDLPPERGSE